MEFKKMVLWSDVMDDYKLLINPDDLEAKVNTGEDGIILIYNVDSDEQIHKKLTDRLEEYIDNEESAWGSDFNPDDEDMLAEFLVDIGYKEVEVERAPTYISQDDLLVFDINNREFYNLNNYSVETVYSYTSEEIIELTNDITETKLEISLVSVSLDEYDGKGFSTSGQFYHEDVYKIFTFDGENVEDKYLLKCWSQWQDDHPTGEIMTSKEIQDHIIELGGRDVEEYMDEIKSL